MLNMEFVEYKYYLCLIWPHTFFLTLFRKVKKYILSSEKKLTMGVLRETCKDGETRKFRSQLDEKLLCIVCGMTLVYPVLQTTCGHRISSICADKLLGRQDSVQHETGNGAQCPAQEDECINLTRDNLHPDRATDKELKRLEVFCKFEEQGCSVIKPWGKLENHEAACQHRVLTCTNEGCNAQIKVVEFNDHVERLCDYSKVTCEDCDEIVLKHDFEEHKQNTCQPKPKECLFKGFGCDFKGLKCDLNKHNKQGMTFHLQFLAVKLLSIQGDVTSIKTALDDKNILLQSSQYNGLSSYDSTQHHLETTSNKPEQMERQLKEITEKLNALQCQIQNGNLQDQNQSSLSIVQRHETELRQCSNRLETVEILIQNPGAKNGVGEKVSRLESSLTTCIDKMSENDIRFRLLETASYNGVLLWKITQYQKRRRDAMEGRIVSLYSQPFYTSEHGYKMCARAYLNGDGLGKGTHLSLFFTVMRGEYDALLKWPFRQKITLMLLDQNGSKSHITDSFRPDVTSTSFIRPTRDMNIASGNPLFAAHQQVEDGRYVRDDTMFIKVIVDEEGLEDM